MLCDVQTLFTFDVNFLLVSRFSLRLDFSSILHFFGSPNSLSPAIK